MSLEKQFCSRRPVAFVLSVLTALAGVVKLLGCAADMDAVSRIILLLLGALEIFCGIVGARLFCKRSKAIAPEKSGPIVYNAMTIYVAGWFFWVLAATMGWFALLYIAIYGGDSVFTGWLFAFFSFGFNLAFYLFCEWRQNYLVLHEAEIIYHTWLGKEKHIRLSDLQGLRISRITGSMKGVGTDGKTLFSFENNMKNVVEFQAAVEDKYRQIMLCELPVEAKPESPEKFLYLQEWLPESEAEKEKQRETAAKIRKWSWIWYVLIWLGIILFFVLCYIEALKLKYCAFAASLLPLSYLLLVWRFPRIVITDDGLYSDTQKWQEFKPYYVLILNRWPGLALAELWISKLFYLCNCMIAGKVIVVIIGILLFVGLMAWTIYRCGGRRGGIIRYFFMGVFLASCLYAAVPNFFWVCAKTPVHEPAVVVGTVMTSAKYNPQCYVTVALPDGNTQRLEISSNLYEKVQEGAQLVTCTRESSLGVKLLSVHRP
jgi:MFS family permease